jgi:hypothetical protein
MINGSAAAGILLAEGEQDDFPKLSLRLADPAVGASPTPVTSAT